jgi:phage host-nuclease inhibitor protein Gam
VKADVVEYQAFVKTLANVAKLKIIDRVGVADGVDGLKLGNGIGGFQFRRKLRS